MKKYDDARIRGTIVAGILLLFTWPVLLVWGVGRRIYYLIRPKERNLDK